MNNFGFILLWYLNMVSIVVCKHGLFYHGVIADGYAFHCGATWRNSSRIMWMLYFCIWLLISAVLKPMAKADSLS